MGDLKQLSSDEIRDMIATGERTSEGWAELQQRNARVRAAMAVTAGLAQRKETANG